MSKDVLFNIVGGLVITTWLQGVLPLYMRRIVFSDSAANSFDEDQFFDVTKFSVNAVVYECIYQIHYKIQHCIFGANIFNTALSLLPAILSAGVLYSIRNTINDVIDFCDACLCAIQDCGEQVAPDACEK